MAKLIRIGNSYGVRIPKALIEKANLDNRPIELKLSRNGLLLKPSKRRANWDSAILRRNAREEQDIYDECMQDFSSEDLSSEGWEW